MRNHFDQADDFDMTISNNIANTTGNSSTEASAVGNQTEAARPTFHPNMFLVRWEIATRAGDWETAAAISKGLIMALPTEPIGWIYHAFAQQQMGRLQEARETLLLAAGNFPKDWRIAYNLACYTNELGDLAEAWNWLKQACTVGDAALIMPLAAKEPTLQSLLQQSRLALELGVKLSGKRPAESDFAAFAA